MTSRSDSSAAALARSPDRHNPVAVGRGQPTGWLWAPLPPMPPVARRGNEASALEDHKPGSLLSTGNLQAEG
jgi:hypothetical protein